MSRYHFEGEFSARKKVDLRGRTRGEENRLQVLDRTRRDRERRRKQKIEAESATRIQAFWRREHAVRQLRARIRDEWVAEYGTFGDRLDRSCLDASSPCLRKLLCSIDLNDREDVHRLAAVCQLILTAQTSPDRLLFCAAFQGGNNTYRTLLHRTKKLLELCLCALERHRQEFVPFLSAPLCPLAAGAGDTACILAHALLTLTSPEHWVHAVGSVAGRGIATALLGHLSAKGLYRGISQMVQVCSPPEDGQPLTALETIAGQTAAWHLECTARTLPQEEIPSCPGSLELMCIPLLWKRCRSIKSNGVTLLRALLAHSDSAELAEKSLPGIGVEGVVGTGEVALALFGNLLQIGTDLANMNAGRRSFWTQLLWCRLAGLMFRLLTLMPLRQLFPALQDEDIDDEPSTSGLHVWPSGQAQVETGRNVPLSLLSQSRCLLEAPGQEFLRVLVQGILPHKMAVDVGVLGDLRILSEGVSSLCGLLGLVLRCQPHLQQQTWLVSLAVLMHFVQRMWFSYLRPAWRELPIGCEVGNGAEQLVALLVLCQVFSCFLVTASVEEVFRRQEPLPLLELYNGADPSAGFIPMLRQAMWQVNWVEGDSSMQSPTAESLRMEFQDACGKLLGQLFDCNSRWKFAPMEAFHATHIPMHKFQMEAKAVTQAVADGTDVETEADSRAFQLLHCAPCLIPFQERAKVFQAQVQHDRLKHQSEDRPAFLGMSFETNKFVTIRRSQLLYDGFNQLNSLGASLKSRVRIQFIDEHGLPEAGVDGGGLFKDFMEELVKRGFDPQYALFTSTVDNQLYPNPGAVFAQPDAVELLTFLGRMLGKAVYEGILLELPLAEFFLKKFRSSYCDINDLPSLDPEMYRSLLTLRNYDGDVSDLSLNFTIVDSVYGDNREVELKPGGQDIFVTNKNAIEYIHRVANYRLNQQVKAVCAAFLQGFFEVIDRDWVRTFNSAELQMLISGSQEGLDLVDMQANVEYAGGYHEGHPVIHHFWEALGTFSPEDQRAFLKFVTACSRAPLLGFNYLQPHLCIQMAGTVLDDSSKDRLPTAATCMNLLKLPPYQSTEIARGKLLYAIKAASGFDLS
ncbi:unnamed protein product [Ostreobium quekettii]|uniref:HECT-type E3 ubiquitin transferase n=1 Tax=Ostreobium quekettii TaxID=121088 RepID=A0A8S1J883_9CHLO|nr:unnamed protein product [Ostreobium quekettii]|eukprot:evm.model.scf_2888.1 EVM.evm.TU.scf_2888.1   scf_2888:11372-17484(+)